eukprot:CAMPEP_0202958554 /NCGR_PEP_ID=MMETSP1396-20130829/2876_1 /ASSEMBLY_ACC=CAM_ASM_000872 /TAXON_ID= /ORGANISM="Pseudokeronopsis sp., Strain Brazil" /LENGTH=70 /DNA_ID=CAMNT_0049676695 /DNA_START=188 /DNA_END=400 /DNA_ORIENTATION=-
MMSYEQHIKSLEEKVDKLQVNDDAKFKIMKDQIGKLNEAIQNEQLGKDIMDEKKGNELKLCENNTSIYFN